MELIDIVSSLSKIGNAKKEIVITYTQLMTKMTHRNLKTKGKVISTKLVPLSLQIYSMLLICKKRRRKKQSFLDHI